MALTPAQLYQLTLAQQALVGGLNADQEAYLVGLCNRLILLKAIRSSPTRSTKMENGVTITYDSPAELGNEIAATEADIAEFLTMAVGGRSASRFLRVGIRSGYHA